MKIELTDISQGVSVSNPTVNVNRMHFKTDTGRTFSVPVAQEHMEALLREIFGEVSEKTAEPEERQEEEVQEDPEFDPEATVFGEGGDDDIPRAPQVMVEEDEGPQSEDEVPSL